MEENGDKKLTDGQLRNGRDMRECRYPESLHREGGREGILGAAPDGGTRKGWGCPEGWRDFNPKKGK